MIKIYRIDDCYTLIAPEDMTLAEAVEECEAITGYEYTADEKAGAEELTPGRVAQFRVWRELDPDDTMPVLEYVEREAKHGITLPILLSCDI